MDCGLETQACCVKDGDVSGMAAAGVLVLDVLEQILVGVVVEVGRRPTRPAAWPWVSVLGHDAHRARRGGGIGRRCYAFSF
jgi:hypothetical protein